MLATHMIKTLIDVDESRTRYDYITIECRMYNCLDGIKAIAPELHHGFTTQAQPWWLGHGLGHLLGNWRTCGGRWLPPGASPSVGGSLMNRWIDQLSLGSQGGVFMTLGSLGACSILPYTRSSSWFP
jgi:hypothetical protein